MIILVSLLLLSLTSHYISSQYVEKSLCTSKCLCLPNEGTVACHESDNIRAIPTNIDKIITRLILQKGSFDQPILYNHNLTGLEHLTFLKIIYYNLQYISSRAFIKMKKLQFLDLSHNQIKKISHYAFSGLSLLELHIMENPNIDIQRKAFTDMTAFTINMRSNNLTDLDYELFKKSKVRYLYLYNNKITAINIKFKQLFNDSNKLLDVSNNPLNCDCSLSWLAEILAIRFSHKKSLVHSKNINISCNKPMALRNKELIFLRPEELKCSPLKIEAVKLHFEGDVTKLTCVSRLGGYKPPTVTWLHYISEHEKKIVEGSTVVEQSKEHILKLKSYNTINVPSNFFNNGISKLVCLSSGPDDSVQRLEIHIHKVHQFTVLQRSNQTNVKKTPLKETNFLFIKHFSILEMLGAVLGTFSATFIGLLILLRYLKSYQEKFINKNDFVDFHKNINSVKPYWYVQPGNSGTYSMPRSHPEYENPATFGNIHDVNNMYPSYTFNRLGFLDYKTQNPIGK